MPPRKRSLTKKKKPQAPPPSVLHVTTLEEFNEKVLQHQGCALVAVVAAFCNICMATVLPYLENLNASRPPALAALNIVVITVSRKTEELCASLEFGAIPTFLSYSYGVRLHSFCGNNMEKALLIAKHAAQQAELDTASAKEKENAGAEATTVSG
ncbi:unnamed protein product [Trypanosoma congolense IL3000]|uniref:WGS project CAEQ00000000 data, annotated contig 290 n=1 Tax=Trypanosoma congolense (strain IL3000) TaxID=1068625 RepID=F9WEM9_TRYCI|nr:unnamed protein product [Trypanosoma congolense IL3000]